MFTGLIETTGKLTSSVKRGNYCILTIQSSIPTSEISLGESIACDGACLTVVAITGNSFTIEASQETLNKTIIGGYANNTLINLERALKMGDRLGGHMVSGHVDTIGNIHRIQKIGDSYELHISFPPQFDSLVIDKGSIAINGISLTVNSTTSGSLSVNIIPHTWRETTLSLLSKQSPVNELQDKSMMKIGKTKAI